MMTSFLTEQITGLSEQEMAEVLKHGVAVHFTTSKIAEQIKASRKMSTLFSEDEKKLIYQGVGETNPESKYVFTTGFGIKNGICAGSITNGYYMFHTPETLSFFIWWKLF